MKKGGVTIYSSSLAGILSALLVWFNLYVESPQTANMNELQSIIDDYNSILATDNNTVTNQGYSAWLYPGEPACGALKEAKNFSFHTLKPEYFMVETGGKLKLMSEAEYGCNGYSAANLAAIKAVSKEQFVTVSSAYNVDIQNFLLENNKGDIYIKQLTKFVVDNDIDGVELDFEDYGGWSEDLVNDYLSFLNRFGTELHKNGKKLMIDLPPVSNTSEEGWYKFKLSQFNNLPVDYIVIMAYDYQYDHGAGQPVSPLSWLKDVTSFTKSKIANHEKIVIGVPTYGYKGNKAINKIEILTYEQAQLNPLFSLLARDVESKELIANKNAEILVVQDEISIKEKVKVINGAGINKVSFWHLGGNRLPK